MGRRPELPQIPPEGESVPIGTVIRYRRLFLGMSAADVAEKAGNYDRSYLSLIERGLQQPSPDLLTGVVEALGYGSLEELQKVPRDEVVVWQEKVKQTHGKVMERKGKPDVSDMRMRDYAEKYTVKMIEEGTQAILTNPDSTQAARELAWYFRGYFQIGNPPQIPD